MSLNRIFITIGLISFVQNSALAAKAPKPWSSEIPKIAKEPGKWQFLQDELMEKEMYYGALATAYRRLMFFQDMPSKEGAYKTIIQLINLGYPQSLNETFVPGDISSPIDYSFDNNYNLYKGMINKQHNVNKWSDYYFNKVDKENFAKYHFFEAINHYRAKRFKEAKDEILGILKKEIKIADKAFVKKIMRTLARIYFEEKEYAKSFQIYEEFLLKTNPLNSSDWLEATWNLYYLGQYKKALGYLYNLESKSISKHINLDKYVLRSLIYREHCDTENMGNLLETFKSNFLKTTDGIKTGESLYKFPQLFEIDIPENQHFLNIVTQLHRLKAEQKNIVNLKKENKELADYLYQSEYRMLARSARALREEVLARSAEKLVIMSESLKFLSFDVVREKFNPDKIFQVPDKNRQLIVDDGDNNFKILWSQFGDYWRDERMNYRGLLVDKCFIK